MLLTSCTTSPKKDKSEILNKIVIPSFPDPIDENGKPLFNYNAMLDAYIVTPEYLEALIKYGLEVEAAAQALEELK